MAQVVSHQGEFEALDTKVVTLSFSAEQWARAWLQETQSPFPLLLDPERNAYRAYGLEHSYLRSWNVRAISYYVRALLHGAKWRGIRGDSGQLGGDFVIDRQGIVRFAYTSHDPTDRPTVDQLLTALRQLG